MLQQMRLDVICVRACVPPLKIKSSTPLHYGARAGLADATAFARFAARVLNRLGLGNREGGGSAARHDAERLMSVLCSRIVLLVLTIEFLVFK